MAFPDTSGAAEPQNRPVVRHHIERGDVAKGSDGAPIGTVVQLVIDRDSGQPNAIVIRSSESSAELELPWSHIVDTAGNQVQLNVKGSDIASVARRFDPAQYVPVDTGETVPPAQADTIAQGEGHPVVTSVESDAVELVEPQLTPDEATRPYATLPPSNLKRTAPLRPEPTPPTQPLASESQGASAEEREVKTETERKTMKPAPNPPPVEPSPLPSTEGELVGGKPSTSGTGDSSTVPTPGTERSDEGLNAPEESLADLAAPTSSAGWPEVLMSTHPVADMASVRTPLGTGQPASATPVSQFGGKVQQISAKMQQTARQATTTAQQTSRRAAKTAQQRTQRARQTIAERWNSPLMLGGAATGLVAGAVIGVTVVMRQRRASAARATTATAQTGAGSLLQQAQASAQGVAVTAQETAARTSLQAKRSARRAARRFRWFRNGLLLGSILGILFAPEAGVELRTQLTNRVEQLRSKIA